MHKFFVDESAIDKTNIKIIGKDVKHMRDVPRLKPNDKIIVSNNNINYSCMITEINKQEVISKIISEAEGTSEPKIEIILYQGLSKGSKMDFILQKGTEIGIKHFYPVATYRSVVKINEAKKEQSKLERWNLITEEAAKQSKRDFIPKVDNILTFDEMIQLLDGENNIIVPYESEDMLTIGQGLESVVGNKIHLIIGPEGGFEDREIEKLELIGSKIVTLGQRILRTETAGFVATTIILYQLGNLGVI
ncbi:MAG: 16S rRNA (uracil(1498)-N(3))-methyltransferase [Tissierellia bacterium]|nr:16S rRNA (uracil(1498)-N(3))-methyltransferase [Tissierellia bacterium]